MLTGPELLLVILIMIIVFGLGKLPDISKKLAQLRLHYEKGVATDMLDITPVEKDSKGEIESNKKAERPADSGE